jgi:hypothetical protein
MNEPDISEALFAQGDLARAIQTICMHKLPFTSAGAKKCEQLIRENGEGNRRLWKNPSYLPSTIAIAQSLVDEARHGFKA